MNYRIYIEEWDETFFEVDLSLQKNLRGEKLEYDKNFYYEETENS